MIETVIESSKKTIASIKNQLMICARRYALFRLCDLYIKEYSQEVMKLSGISTKIARDDWHLAWELAVRARTKSSEVLLELRQHKVENGC